MPTRPWWQADPRSARLHLAFVRATVCTAPSLAALVLVLLLLTGLVPPLLMLSVGRAVSLIGPAVHQGSRSVAAGRLDDTLLLTGALFALDQIIGPLLRAMGDRLAMRLRAEIFQRIFAAEVEPASIAHLEDPELRNVLDRAAAIRWIGTRWAVVGLVNRWTIRLGGAGGLVLVFVYRWWAGLV
ncbi:MAG TPA: hypothetical protein VIJ76_04010, partial [Galbitalea sp.]